MKDLTEELLDLTGESLDVRLFYHGVQEIGLSGRIVTSVDDLYYQFYHSLAKDDIVYSTYDNERKSLDIHCKPIQMQPGEIGVGVLECIDIPKGIREINVYDN